MPQRPRNHQLEDQSINYFKGLLPPEWICREKDKDYGVDLEVEIFDENGLSTGIMFYVQLKATDNVDKAQKVQMKVDNLRYLASLDIPAMIVRYCEVNKTIFWIWNFNTLNGIKTNAKTSTINMTLDDVWDENSIGNIMETLSIIRCLQASEQNQRFTIQHRSTLSYKDTIICRDALQYINSNLPFLNLVPDETTLNFDVNFNSEFMSIRINCIASLTFNLNKKIEKESIASNLMYGFAALLKMLGFQNQAVSTSTKCLELNIISQSKELAADVASLLTLEPNKIVDLAIKNKIHEAQDLANAKITMTLIADGAKTSKSTNAIHKFCSATIEFQKKSSINTGALEYSLGSNFRVSGKYSLAVKYYNMARKSEPSYLKRAYFWKELGGIFFINGNFKWSVQAYKHAYTLEPSNEIAFTYADALLYNNQFNEAKLRFTEVSKQDGSIGSESRLKEYVSDWLSHKNLKRGMQNEGAILAEANQHLQNNELDDAFIASLTLAFLYEKDPELWKQAMHLCSQSALSTLFFDVISLAVLHCELVPYTMMREEILTHSDKSDEELVELDQIVMDIHENILHDRSKPTTLRLLGDTPSNDLIFNKSN